MSSIQKRSVQQAESRQPSRPLWLLPVAIGAGVLILAVALVWLWQSRQAAAAAYTPEVTGGPSAQIDQAQFDYGDVKLGTTIKSVFRIKNVGDAQLAFRGEPRVEVVEGCCPPRATVGRSALSPGEETTVELQFMMHEGMGGQHEFRVHVVTNDLKNPEQTVAVRSNWVP